MELDYLGDMPIIVTFLAKVTVISRILLTN